MTLAEAIDWCVAHQAYVQFLSGGWVTASIGPGIGHTGYGSHSFQEAVDVAAKYEALQARTAIVEMP